MATESASGIVLLVGALLALLWANSPWPHCYDRLLEHHFAVALGFWSVDQPFHFWVNDVLMVFFFFLVGLEIKREAVIGGLSDRRPGICPSTGARGARLAPAIIFTAI